MKWMLVPVTGLGFAAVLVMVTRDHGAPGDLLIVAIAVTVLLVLPSLWFVSLMRRLKGENERGGRANTPQFKIRSLMLIIAVMALAFGESVWYRTIRSDTSIEQVIIIHLIILSAILVLWARRDKFRDRAAHWKQLEEVMEETLRMLNSVDGSDFRSWKKQVSARLTHCKQLRAKYEDAATFPWRPVEPDQAIMNDENGNESVTSSLQQLPVS